MSPEYAVVVMMSNYFHDVATAMIMACAVGMWVILRKYEGRGSSGPLVFLMRLYRGMWALVIISWAWVVTAGLLRLATFRSYEWPIAMAKHQEAGLLLKYGIAVSMVAAGSYLWLRVTRRMKTLSASGLER